MESEDWEQRQTGIKHALAAWALLLVVISALQVVDLLWNDHAPLGATRSHRFSPLKSGR